MRKTLWKEWSDRRGLGRFSRGVGVFALIASLGLSLLPLSSGATDKEFVDFPHLRKPAFKLHDTGNEDIINYEKYGKFEGLGTGNFKYTIVDRPGLSRAAGEGVYPNYDAAKRDPAYRSLPLKALEGDNWTFIYGPELQHNFFKWATSNNCAEPAVCPYFTALALERAGLLYQALKAYHAILVHFPRGYGITFWKTPWYVAPTALDRIQFILRTHPELGLRLEGAESYIINGFNARLDDDIYVCNPGRFVRVPTKKKKETSLDLSAIPSKVVFNGKNVQLVKYDNGHWQMKVNGEPFMVRGIAYAANPVGMSPDFGTLDPNKDWMTYDSNNNGKADSPYDSWVDKNRNNIQDEDEKVVGDLQLMKDMGVNTMRIYHHMFSQGLLDDMYNNYGIHVMMGDLLGAYTMGSEASWNPGTDYSDPEQRQAMKDSVRKMVEEYKDHPAVLMWVLGNENIYGTQTNAPDQPVVFYTFANEVAKMIKSIDPNHPVAISNGDLVRLDMFANLCPDIDIFGCNSYRGNHGFGQSFWSSVQRLTGKPVVITEFGCPAYARGYETDRVEELQANYLKQNWLDIEANQAGHGVGNAIGGVAFEWLDEWWKAGAQYSPDVQDVTGQFPASFSDGWMYEEFLGLASQGDGKSSPFLRQLRKSYFTLQKLWNPKGK